MSFEPNIDPTTFEIVRRLILDKSGIALGPDKHYLVQLRLGPLAKAARCASIAEYVSSLTSPACGSRQTDIIEAMTTNETSFFRDVSPFDALRLNILPELCKLRDNGERIRIWCAAASTGQEPYSIALIIRDHFPQLNGRVEIVATDLAKSVLTIAKAGRYSQLEVNRGLPAPLLIKHFRQEGTEWALNEEVKRMVDFRPMNLISAWPTLGSFDLIFIRNVMIYFNVETKKEILRKARGILHPQGYLFLGAAETTIGIDETFQRQTVGRASCYRPPTAAVAAGASAVSRPGMVARAAA